MRSKILTGAAAFALAATAGLAMTAPASARHMHARWTPGYVAAGIAGGIVGGALATATAPFWGPSYYGYPGSYDPGYAYGPGFAYGPGYGPYQGYRYSGYRYYGPGRYGHCFQTCPDRM